MELIGWFFLSVLVWLLYILPSIIALIRWKNNFYAILLINLLLGWTLIGWVGALIWAVIKEKTDNPKAFKEKAEQHFKIHNKK